MSALLPLLAEPAVGEEGWTALLSWGGVTACACALVMLLARTLLPLLVPEGWSAMISKKAAHATPCSKHVTEWIPGLVVPYLVTRDMIAMTRDAIANPAHSLLLAPRPGLWSATGAILGYMAFDCVVMAVWRRETISSGGKAMYMQLWGHHVLSLLFWPYALAKKRGCILVAWFLFSEVPTPLPKPPPHPPPHPNPEDSPPTSSSLTRTLAHTCLTPQFSLIATQTISPPWHDRDGSLPATVLFPPRSRIFPILQTHRGLIYSSRGVLSSSSCNTRARPTLWP